MAIDNMMEFTFIAECPIPGDVQQLLVPGEQPVAAYKTLRDSAIFTDRRLILRDAQGITGKKVEVYSIPWKAVQVWSSENAGHIDINAELELWTHVGQVKVNLKRDINIRRLDLLIGAYVLK